jgi:hypothetical protein
LSLLEVGGRSEIRSGDVGGHPDFCSVDKRDFKTIGPTPGILDTGAISMSAPLESYASPLQMSAIPRISLALPAHAGALTA